MSGTTEQRWPLTMTSHAHATGRRAVKAVVPAAGPATRFLPAAECHRWLREFMGSPPG